MSLKATPDAHIAQAFDWGDLLYPDASVTAMTPITLAEYRRRESNERPRATYKGKRRVNGGGTE